MKACIRNLFILTVLTTGLAFMQTSRVTAQTFTTLYSFTALDLSFPRTNSDGANPQASLILSNGTLYGTARYGGDSGNGTVFAVNTDGTGFTNLHTFTGGSDGGAPGAGLILLGNTLYGTAESGGSSGFGTVFKMNTDGTGFTNLHNFVCATGGGGSPAASLVLSGNTLYGTANACPGSGFGTVFKVNTDGTGFATLHDFTGSDGGNPIAGLTLSGNTLYGTAYSGGSSGFGTVFAVRTNGTGFINLYSFTAFSSATQTNRDGAYPQGGVILSGNTLYGTAGQAGSSGNGTVFALNTNGTGFRTLHNFAGASDGSYPLAGLFLSNNTLYGTADLGGSSGFGAVFALNTNGTGFKALYSFTALDPGSQTNSDGTYPQGSVILSGNTLYGTASSGGGSGSGTLFSLSLGSVSLPQLTIIPFGASLVLTWPINSIGFTLQSTTNLGSSAVWTTNSPPPIVVNGKFTLTNPISGTRQFFRLRQ